MGDFRSGQTLHPASEGLGRPSVLAAALAPLLLAVGFPSAQGFAYASTDGFSAPIVSAEAGFWLSDAPFQTPALNAGEDVAEHAAAPRAVQAEDVLMPIRVAVRRTRIGGLYGP